MGRWAKNHDQRKGQWLINEIRSKPEFQKTCERISKEDKISYSEQEKHMIEMRLWDMTNDEFEKIMEKYYD